MLLLFFSNNASGNSYNELVSFVGQCTVDSLLNRSIEVSNNFVVGGTINVVPSLDISPIIHLDNQVVINTVFSRNIEFFASFCGIGVLIREEPYEVPSPIMYVIAQGNKFKVRYSSY